ncbi:multidrug effflux MFS transporter [Roseomonas sp. NAR14]|uniref:Bcr/CflA family efflux transporter n=1 Tax=Roseomonas acroporae TaxID=2937791 RepID=A0A9X1Y9W1_9PROT|nr:multidrug effflux MFS transporter [Roseomonas acroporae]MCK8786213.1 multidrug effflux MFS transporter [Roseomonas acroporae]
MATDGDADGRPGMTAPGHDGTGAPPPAGVPVTAMVVVALAALVAVGPLAIDMYLPAMPDIAADLGATPGAVQGSLSLFLLGFAAGQLFWGPLSDRIGRRRPVAAGMLLFIAAGAACAFATGAGQLSGLRLAQSLGAAAGPVLARAMVRDLAEREAAASLLSALTLVMSIAPLAAPMIGAEVLALGGWRPIFLVLAVLGLLILLLAWLAVPETLPAARRRQAPALSIGYDYLSLLTDRRFLMPALAAAAPQNGMFAYIVASPFVFVTQFGLPPWAFSLIFASNVVGIIIGTAMNRRLLRALGLARLQRLGVALLLVAGGMLLLAALGLSTGLLHGWQWLPLPLFLYLAAFGFVVPNATAAALTRAGRMAGTASAVLGCLGFGGGAVAGGLVGLIGGGPALAMALVMAGLAVVCAVTSRIGRDAFAA